jgi:hypothetical protein
VEIETILHDILDLTRINNFKSYQEIHNKIHKENSIKNMEGVNQKLIEEIRIICINYHNLIISVRRNNVIEKIANLAMARQILNNAKIILFAKIDPLNNEYVDKYLKYYNWLSDNMGRIEADLDNIENDLSLRVVSSMQGKEQAEIALWLKTLSYKRILNESLYHLILHPLRNALVRFTNINPKIQNDKGEVIEILVKDEKLFYYIYFVEIYQTYQILGSLTKAIAMGKAVKGYAQTNPVGNPQNAETNLPETPSNAKTVKFEETITEKFKEPDTFKEVDNESF